MVTCPSCGRDNPPGSRFCNACATELSAEAPARKERKVVSVLFCDLVGFTGASETRDPEDVEATLSRYHRQLRSELERHGGTVEKFIGDAVMAVFGAPLAHEDDPERAVRAALAIRDGVADSDLHVRIGITTGEALVSLAAEPRAGEGIVAGDVVNTAARLEAAASTDAILVDETTWRATERAIRYREHDPVIAKGKSQPLAVWEALDARSRFGVDVAQFARAPLVGRDAELEALVVALARARSRREPQLVTIIGVPGIGKSRLVWELFRHVDTEQEFVTWRQGRSLPYGDGVSFWALGEIVKAQAGVLESDSAETATEKLTLSLTELLADEAERAWVEAHLRPLLGLREEHQLQPDRQSEAFAAWRRFLEAVAEQGPAVLVFEDLHWADEALLDFVDELVEWLSDVPLLVVATARPELLVRRPAWAGGKANALTLSLAPLSQDEVVELVQALFDQPLLTAADVLRLVERAEGNPLYAEEFARLAAERHEEAALPETVQGVIAARLDTLGGEEK